MKVCLEKFPKNGRIFRCFNCHFLCGSCKSHGSGYSALEIALKTKKKKNHSGPKCKKKFVGRVHATTLKTLLTSVGNKTEYNQVFLLI